MKGAEQADERVDAMMSDGFVTISNFRRRTVAGASAAVVSMALLGCSSSRPTASTQTTPQWDDARSQMMLQIATEQFENGEVDKADQTIADSLAMGRASAEVLILKGRIEIEQNNLPAATQAIEQAIARSPRAGEAYYLRGIVAEIAGDLELALQCYDYAAEFDPRTPDHVLAGCEVLVRQGKVDEASARIEATREGFASSSAIQDLAGQLAELRGDAFTAADHYRRALLVAPADEQVRRRLALALLASGQPDAAVVHLDQLLPEDPSTAGTAVANLYVLLGDARRATGSPARAIDAFRGATKADPDNPIGWMRLADTSIASGDYATASSALDRASKLPVDESQTTELSLLGAMLNIRLDKPAAAATLLRGVLEKEPEHVDAWLLSGRCLEMLGRPAEAAACYERALALRPGDELAITLRESLP